MDAWEEQIRASDRPSELVSVMIAISDGVSSLYGPSSGHKVVGYSAIPEGQGTLVADRMLNNMFERLSRNKQRAVRLVSSKATDLAARLATYVKDKTGYAGTLQAELVKAQFIQRVDRYLDSGSNDLRPYASAAVQAWIGQKNDVQALRDLLTPVLQRASAHARMVVRTEMQNSYVDLTREALSMATLVERVVYAGACDQCRSRAGLQPKTEDAFWTHPNCACTWRQVASEDQNRPAPATFSAVAVIFG